VRGSLGSEIRKSTERTVKTALRVRISLAKIASFFVVVFFSVHYVKNFHKCRRIYTKFLRLNFQPYGSTPTT